MQNIDFYKRLIENNHMDEKHMVDIINIKNSGEISKLVDILTTDRNNDNMLTVEDLLLIGKDPIAIVSLICVIIVILPEANYEDVLKVILYIVLEIIPRKYKTSIIKTQEDKEKVIGLILILNKFITSSAYVKKIINKIENSKCCITLCGSEKQKKEILEKHSEKLQNQIESTRFLN